MTTTLEDDHDTRALELRRPDTPGTLSELAAYKGEAIEFIEARAQVLYTLRLSSIRATHPTDWVLFKAPDEHGGQIVGYLDDAGCDRVRDLFGIEVYGISAPQKIASNEGFLYVITGSGRSKFTLQQVEAMEGGRSSTDDFVKDVSGPALELLVRKAARANLDGNVTRELAGLKSVPIEELARAWDGTPKKVEQCRLGRGFGSRAERLGAQGAAVPNVPPPVCPYCKTPGVFRPSKDNRAAFYGCAKWKEHPKGSKPFIVDAAEWVKEQQPKAAPAAPAPAAPAAENGPCVVCGMAKPAHANADHEYEAK